MEHDIRSERRLAVMTNWGFFGSLGLCLAISGFAGADLWSGLAGFALLAAGFGAHVIVNRIYDSVFTKGEVALGFVAFAVAVTSFIVSWIAAPRFDSVNMAIGLTGFGALVACFTVYMVANHGVRGSIAMFDRIRLNDPSLAREPAQRRGRRGDR